MSFEKALVSTEGTLASWWSLPELLLISGVSSETRVLLRGWNHLWEQHLRDAKYEQPSAFREALHLAAGILRRRRAQDGRMFPLRKRERLAASFACPRKVLVTLFGRTNQELLAYERGNQDGLDFASRYPRGICRECGRYSNQRLVWGGRCSPCFDNNVDEWSATEASHWFGMSRSDREHLPYRMKWSGFGHRRLYRTSDLWNTLRTFPETRSNNRRSVAIRLSRAPFKEFRAAAGVSR